MRLLRLYARSRRIGYAVAVLIALGVAARLTVDLPTEPWRPVPLLLLPLAVAVVTVGTVWSPFGDTEVTSALSRRLRLLHLSVLTLTGLAVIHLTVAGWDLTGAATFAARSLMLLTNLTLLAGWLFGSRVSWVVPLAYAALLLTIGHGSRLTGWALEDADHQRSMLIASALFTIGVGLITLDGPSETQRRRPIDRLRSLMPTARPRVDRPAI